MPLVIFYKKETTPLIFHNTIKNQVRITILLIKLLDLPFFYCFVAVRSVDIGLVFILDLRE
jgi:hypothetical protein